MGCGISRPVARPRQSLDGAGSDTNGNVGAEVKQPSRSDATSAPGRFSTRAGAPGGSGLPSRREGPKPGTNMAQRTLLPTQRACVKDPISAMEPAHQSNTDISLAFDTKSEIPDTSKRMVGVAQWNRTDYDVDDNNAAYGNSFYQASVAIGQTIAEAKVKNFKDAWESCRTWRAGYLNKHPSTDTAIGSSTRRIQA
jgi:hypothetical protein